MYLSPPPFLIIVFCFDGITFEALLKVTAYLESAYKYHAKYRQVLRKFVPQLWSTDTDLCVLHSGIVRGQWSIFPLTVVGHKNLIEHQNKQIKTSSKSMTTEITTSCEFTPTWTESEIWACRIENKVINLLDEWQHFFFFFA